MGAVIRKSGKDPAICQCRVNLAENGILQFLIEDGPGQSGEDGIRSRNLFRIQMIAQTRCTALDDPGIWKFARDFLCQNGAFFDGRKMCATWQTRENVSCERSAAGPKLDDARCHVQI